MTLFLCLNSLCDLIIVLVFYLGFNLSFIANFLIFRLCLNDLFHFGFLRLKGLTDVIGCVFVLQVLPLLDSELVEELLLILELPILVNPNSGIRGCSCNHLQ